MSNSQRVAIITGASQGIGEGLVSAYRKLGYAVAANSRRIADSAAPLAHPSNFGRSTARHVGLDLWVWTYRFRPGCGKE